MYRERAGLTIAQLAGMADVALHLLRLSGETETLDTIRYVVCPLD